MGRPARREPVSVPVPVPVLVLVLAPVWACARHVRVRWRIARAVRQLARVLGVTHPGELVLEHRTFCDELLVPLKRHCQLALVRACNRVLLCAWRLLRAMCLRLRVRV